MRNFRVGDILSLDDGDWAIEGLQGGILRIRNQLTHELRVIHTSALPHLLAIPPKLTRDTPQPRDLEQLSKQEAEEIRILSAHVEEVLYGRPIADGPARTEYDPSMTTSAQRIQRKVAELNQGGFDIKERTLQRMMDDYRAYGPAGLIDQRKLRTTKPLGRIDPRMQEALVTVISAATNASTKTTTAHIAAAKAEVLRKYPGETVPIPADRTLRRAIEVLTKGKYTTGNAPNRRSAANVRKKMFKARPAIAPGHEVQIDTSPFDILVRGDDGKPVRAKLSVMLDKATHSVIGTSVTLSTKGVDLAFMLAQCLTPRPARPKTNATHTLEELRRMPWAAHLTEDELESYDLARPFIKPQRIITDNGKDYLSTTFRSGCESFGIDITQSATHTPTDKASVERSFSTVWTTFAQYVPGHTGGSVDRRGKAPESEDLLDIYTLAELFDRWVSVVWQNMQHEALRDPVHPQIIHSPNSMYTAMFDMTGFVPIPITAHDYIALLPTVERMIQSDGIQMQYRRYDSIHLHPYRGQPSGKAGNSLKWTIHYNPNDPAAVWVKDPETEDWIQCDWMNKDLAERPFSASIRRKAREISAAYPAYSSEERLNRTIEMIGQTREAQAAHRRQEMKAQTERKLAERTGKNLPKPTKLTSVSTHSKSTPKSKKPLTPMSRFDPKEA